MPKLNRFWPTLLIALLATLSVSAETDTRLLRYPDIHHDRVVFCYAGDLWTAPADGGTATRLTAHPGLELFPKFSPDGRWVAFTGQYDGDEQVYVVPSQGGVPRQLTFYPARGPLPPRWGYDNQVYGWTPDGEQVLFRSLRDGWDLSDSRLYTVPVGGGLPTALPMPVSGAGVLSPDGRRVVYSPLFRDFRTWKRYEGGWAQDLFLFDLATHAAENITDHPRTDRDPMWIGDAICYASDRDGTLNLYRYDLATRQTRQLTHSTTWDVRWPSAGTCGRIVYELDGRLRIHDPSSGQDRAISVFVPNDGVAMRPARQAVVSQIQGFGLSPKGERALFIARGDVFTVPVEKGFPRNLTNSSTAHDRHAAWSPDGAQVAFISDQSGEEEVWLVPQDGSAPPRQLTRDGRGMRHAPVWSPDGRHLAVGDKDGGLSLVQVADGASTRVVRDPGGSMRSYTWSPDSRYLAFTLQQPNGFSTLHLWSVTESRLIAVTDDRFPVANPTWDPAGNYLFFLSRRDYAPQISQVEWNFAGNRMMGVFAMALRKDVPHPFAPESDEVTVAPPAGEAGADPAAGRKAADSPPDPLVIDFDGLAGRVARVPLEGDNYAGLTAVKGHLLLAVHGAPFYGRPPAGSTRLLLYNLKTRKADTVAEDLAGAAVSADGTKLLVRQGPRFLLHDIPPKGKDAAKTVSVAELAVDRVPAEEWATIFDEVWRRFRDFFYVENMHGYDWPALRDQYRSLLPHVAHRSDLNYLLGEMIAELNAGHAYIEGGDYETPARPAVALPGARFAPDPASGRYRITEILAGHNEEPRYRSPLTEIGVDARVGDYVMAIDGVDLTTADNPYRLLTHKANRPVTLTLSAKADGGEARRVTYSPIRSETQLVYLRWVNRRAELTEQLSGGRAGYLHIPDMGADGAQEFIKWFYPQVRKESLVIDARGNGGGNISAWVIERLRRTLLGTGFSRTSDYTSTYPGAVHIGPKVCLLNETSASDGDIFPYMFRQAGLGQLVGKRSWGGVIGITGHGPLLDGGQVFVPQFGNNAADGSWAIEGHGVDPDIVVENDPASVLSGRDPQLERAVQVVLEELATRPAVLPTRPAPPVKTR